MRRGSDIEAWACDTEDVVKFEVKRECGLAVAFTSRCLIAAGEALV